MIGGAAEAVVTETMTEAGVAADTAVNGGNVNCPITRRTSENQPQKNQRVVPGSSFCPEPSRLLSMRLPVIFSRQKYSAEPNLWTGSTRSPKKKDQLNSVMVRK